MSTISAELKQKRQQCWSKQGEKEIEISNLSKQLNSANIVSDLDIIKNYLSKKFGFDFEAERAEVFGQAEKLKQEIRRLQSEVKQFRNCWEQHYPTNSPHGKETGAACENCKFEPFYAEKAEQEADIAKRQQEKAQREREAAEQKKAKAARRKE
jgi:hypothetical protein